MPLNIRLPDYELPDKNVFNLRQFEWEDSIVPTVLEMLKAGEEYGIVVKGIELVQDPINATKEIRKTISRQLNITIGYLGDKDITISYEIPWLVGNHFFIGGNKKVCTYQLFDKPVINRKNSIKIRTNIQTFTLTKKTRRTKEYFWNLQLFNKDVPFAHIIRAKLGSDNAVIERFGLKEDGTLQENIEDASPEYLDLLYDISKMLTDEDINRDSLMTRVFNRRQDSVVIENIDLITKVDIFSVEYLKTGNIIEEFLDIIVNGSDDDLDYLNKRIRFTEVFIFTHLAKDFYNMIVTLKGATKKINYHVNSKIIVHSANQSTVKDKWKQTEKESTLNRIVQFDHSINPLSELALLSRLSLTGPGGFKKDNVPPYLRDIHHSMFGKVCAADTGDRENCGTTQYMVPVNQFDDNLTFIEQTNNVITSTAISHVPCLEHDDQTRLQMSSSQQRHAIALQDFDVPIIQSGVEGMYTEYTTFMFKAKHDGKVVFKDRNIIIVKYHNGESEAFNIGYRKQFLTVADFFKTYFNEGDSFKSGDIISESNYLNNGRLNLGKNLKTAVMVWYGYNYEDGIVISDRLVKDDVFTSLHYLDLTFEIPTNKMLMNLNDSYDDYKPLPVVGDRLTKGDIYAKIQTIIGVNDSNDVIFNEPQEYMVTEDCIVTDVKLYANKWSGEIPQYNEFIKDFVSSKKEKKDSMINTLSEYLTQDELESFLESVEIDQTEKKRGNYRMKGDIIEGVRIEITAIYKRPITVGDKIGNRHGNKGVISRIVDQSQMPRFSNGETADVVINPLGIISRMNIGQLFELHLAQSVVDLKKKVAEMLNDDQVSWENIKKYVIDYINIIDKTHEENYTFQMVEYLNSISREQFKSELNDFYVVQPPFESVAYAELVKAMEYTHSPMLYHCFDPVSAHETPIKNIDGFDTNVLCKIAFGSMYFIKLNHIAKDKKAARSIGPYAPRTSQPLEGKGRKGGQRLGEMEVWAMIGHGAIHNLEECLTTKSDSIKKRNEYLSRRINNDDMLLDEEDDGVSQSTRLFQCLLKMVGLNYQINEEEI